MYYSDYNKIPDGQEPFAATFRVSPEEPPKKKKNRMGAKITAACLACALVGGLAGGGGVLAMSGMLGGGSTTLYEGAHAPTVVSIANVTAKEPLTVPQIYATYVGSAVGITTELVTTNFFGQSVPAAAAGSGFVYSADGYIVTNYHVIEGASAIKVNFIDGKSYDAKLVSGEKENDIAVLKIDATGLTPVIIGNSDNLSVGETVVAIGNPLGELTYSLTQGVVSAKDRSVTMSDGTRMNMLQTDTAINSGNSGGPLFNIYGQVIGITSAKLSGNSNSSATIEGLGFAIPMNDVKDMIQSIISNGYVTGKPNVGILMNDVSAQTAQRYGLPAGVYVEAVLDGASGAKAGLKSGDIITAVNGTTVTGSDQLKSIIKKLKVGDTAELVVTREGKSLTLSVVLEEETAERSAAMNDLQTKLQEEYNQQQQQQQQQQSGFSTWPFGGMNPFGF